MGFLDELVTLARETGKFKREVMFIKEEVVHSITQSLEETKATLVSSEKQPSSIGNRDQETLPTEVKRP